jgi:hypothetical protein
MHAGAHTRLLLGLFCWHQTEHLALLTSPFLRCCSGRIKGCGRDEQQRRQPGWPQLWLDGPARAFPAEPCHGKMLLLLLLHAT